jgi:hypothetical protein
MNDYKDANSNQSNKEIRESNAGTDNSTNQSVNTVESQQPKKKHFNVLHEDGSLADLPDRDINGAGAQSAAITE